MENAINTASLEQRRIVYDDGVTRGFVIATLFWGLVGMLVGLLGALQLSFWQFNLDLPWLTFGRIRPLHTNAVIFALVGNMMFAGIYYSTQRLLKVRMASNALSQIHLWGWQLLIIGAAVTLPLGLTQSKEYAELEWFLDLGVAAVWVVFAINFFWTLKIRNERHLYVALWFYIATILTIAVLYIVNNLALPVTGTKSYGLFAGAQDALTQWWYGHNAVAFFLTTPILGIMYYFLPKAADRPVFSYRLSIIHFWALVFLYIWAGPHHLLYTALPDWAQTLGMLFSLMLWAPSWGGMLNGLLTLRGAWHKVRTDPVLKFFVAGVTFYGMATFEGPLLSVKSVNALGHYTDWIIGHVHSGALGWNGLMTAGMFYWLAPRLWGAKLHSKALADWHFWIATVGILFYVGSMWVAGITSGLMQQAQTADGALQYAQWVSIIDAVRPSYMFRTIGGGLFIVGWIMMIYNIWRTAAAGQRVNGEVDVAVLVRPSQGGASVARLVFGSPFVLTAVGLVGMFLLAKPTAAPVGLGVLLLVAGITAFQLKSASAGGRFSWHETVERKPLAFSLLVAVAVLVGGVVELIPGIVVRTEVPMTADGHYAVEPYTALELEGRDIYVREGCYTCHSQMVRPFRAEWQRYGEPSRIEESMWDRPFQWGSKRTGPDLARVGGKMNNAWHYQHMLDPRSTSPGSNMPNYPWLLSDKVDAATTPFKLKSMKALGVPYTDAQIDEAGASMRAQADEIVADLREFSLEAAPESELVALIAYLQRLGKNAKPTDVGKAN
ncbi:MAG: cytochrome-c oxidase, cbb3-type subunit I [Planctomycetota bacterium]